MMPDRRIATSDIANFLPGSDDFPRDCALNKTAPHKKKGMLLDSSIPFHPVDKK
jgi:hypothetical protein